MSRLLVSPGRLSGDSPLRVGPRAAISLAAPQKPRLIQLDFFSLPFFAITHNPSSASARCLSVGRCDGRGDDKRQNSGKLSADNKRLIRGIIFIKQNESVVRKLCVRQDEIVFFFERFVI